MSIADHWTILGIAPTDDKRLVKRAYAGRLKTIDVDSDPAAFHSLREAYDAALAWGTRVPWWEQDFEFDEEVGASELDEGNQAGQGSTITSTDEDYCDVLDRRRPPALHPHEDELSAFCGQLDTLLYGEETAAPETLAGIVERILAAPELEEIDRVTEIETWLAQTIVWTTPRSDPIIPAVIRHFGWARDGRQPERDWNIESVLDRRDDLDLMRKWARPEDVNHRAWRELTGPPRSRIRLTELGLAEEVAYLLNQVDARSTLHHDIPAGTIGWWRNYFFGPHFPSGLWAIIASSSFMGFLIGMVVVEKVLGQGRMPPFLVVAPPILACAALVSFGLAWLWAHAAATWRRIRAREMSGREPRQVTIATGAALALPLVVAVFPDWGATGALGALVSLPLGSWILVQCSSYVSFAGSGAWRRRFLPIVGGACALFAAFSLKDPIFLPILCLLGGAALIALKAHDVVADHLSDVGRSPRLKLSIASLLLGLGAGVALLQSIVDWPADTVSLVIVPVAIFGMHLGTAASPVDVSMASWPLRVAVGLFYIFGGSLVPAGFAPGAFVVTGLYGLGYALVQVAAALKFDLAVKAGN